MSTFMGLEIGKRSIVTHQVALDVTGHNIANANTPGYSRQAANIVTTPPWHTPVLVGNARVGQLGTGSEVADIQRYRDSFIDAQIRNESRTAGYWQSVQESLAQIEVILNEPSNEGLRRVMDSFWQSWQDLSANPESEAVRSVVKERGAALADTFKHTFQQLTDLRDDVNSSIKVDVEEINSIAQQVADLNRQILAIRVAGKQPNDLMDTRDLLIDQLSGLVNITVTNESNSVEKTDTGLNPVYNGMVSIQLGGRTLVQGGEVCKLTVEPDSQGMNLVIWADTQAKAKIEGGELRGLLDVRGRTRLSGEINPWDSSTLDFTGPSEYKEIIPAMIANLNALAETIIERTNEIQRSGYSLNNKSAFPDGTNFFNEDIPSSSDGNWASFMQIDAAINTNVSNIAAASSPTWSATGEKVNFGDGSNALSIAQLKHDSANPLLINATTDDFWRGICAETGVQSQEAQRMVTNQDKLLIELENVRQSLSGVSLDEEMTSMIKFQHAYNAASRYITTIDEQLDQIINKMGLVGR